MHPLERDQIQLALRKRIDALAKGYRQNIGIIGPEGLGKSHLFRTAFYEFLKHPGFICLHLKAESFDYEQIVERWTGAVLAGFLLSEGFTVTGRDFQSFYQACEPRIPKTLHTVQQIRRMLRKEKNTDLVRELFALSGILSRETGKKILLMIDEFQELEKLPATDPFLLLGKEIMIQTHTLYLVSSSRPARAREIFREKLSLLFGNFEVIEMQPFQFEETIAFLSRHFPRVLFSNAQKKFLMTLTGGDPLYLDLLADRLKFYLSSQAEQFVSNQLIFLAFQEELLDHKGRIALIFERMIHTIGRTARDTLPYLRTLMAVSEGHHKVATIASYINRKTADTKKIIGRLIHEDKIRKNGSFYRIEDPLFRFWLREVFGRRSKLYSPDEKEVADELYESLHQLMERICRDDRKDLTMRVEALFKEFRGDIVEIDGKKWRCPQFAEIMTRPGSGRFCTLIAKSPKEKWICQIARQKLLEDDIVHYLEETKRLRKKIRHKMIIALGGIEQNAKLMAQAAKILICTLGHLNELLELYDQPKIIVLDDRGLDGETLGAVAEGLHKM